MFCVRQYSGHLLLKRDIRGFIITVTIMYFKGTETLLLVGVHVPPKAVKERISVYYRKVNRAAAGDIMADVVDVAASWQVLYLVVF